MSSNPSTLTPEERAQREAAREQQRLQRAALYARAPANPTTTTTTTTTPVAPPQTHTTTSAIAPTTTTTTTTTTAATTSPPQSHLQSTTSPRQSNPTVPQLSGHNVTGSASNPPNAINSHELLPTPQHISILSPGELRSSSQTQSQSTQRDWQHIYDEYVHQVIRHVFRITTDSDILSNSILDAKDASPQLSYSLSSLVKQTQSQAELEQHAGYSYLPLFSKLLLGEFVSEGLTRACICTPVTSASATPNITGKRSIESPLPAQNCPKCKQTQPFIKVGHLESIFAEMNSLMVGYQEIPGELIQSKAVLQELPTLDDCFNDIGSLISNVQVQSDKTDDKTNHTEQQLLSTLLDTSTSTTAIDIVPVPLTDLNFERNDSKCNEQDKHNLLKHITYQQQSALLIGALSTQAITNQLLTRKLTKGTNNEEHIEMPPFLRSNSSQSPPTPNNMSTSSQSNQSNQSTQSNITPSAPTDQTSSLHPSSQSYRLGVVSSLISSIRLRSSLSLSSPLTTISHLTYNTHNATLRSRNLLWWYIQSYHRLQTLYEYLSTLGSMFVLGGVGVHDLVSKLNRVLDLEINELNIKLKNTMSDDDDMSKYTRGSSSTASLMGLASSTNPIQIEINNLQSRKIDFNLLKDVQAQGSTGDLVHLVNMLAGQRGDVGKDKLHNISFGKGTEQVRTGPYSDPYGQVFTGMDQLSMNTFKLLSIDSNGNNLPTVLGQIAENRLLHSSDFLTTAQPPETLTKLSNPDHTYSNQSEGMRLSKKHLEQTLSLGYHPNTIYTPISHPGLTPPGPDGEEFFNPIQQKSAKARSQDVLFTLNHDSSDTLFTSLICPQVQPLTAAVVSSMVQNQVVLDQNASNSSNLIVDSVNPIPIFAYLHSKIAKNDLIPIATSKGYTHLPMIMLVNSLLHALSTISHRLLSAVGTLLLIESDLALTIIHEHFNAANQALNEKVNEKKKVPRQAVTIGAVSNAFAATPIANDITKQECLQLLVEKTPNIALYLQSVQAAKIKHSFQESVFETNRSTSLAVSNFVQSALTTTQSQQTSQVNSNTTSSTHLHVLVGNGKRIKVKFAMHPFCQISSQSHDYSQVLGLFSAYGLHKSTLTQSCAPLIYNNYYTMSLTRNLPTVNFDKNIERSVERVEKNEKQSPQYQVTTPQTRLPIPQKQTKDSSALTFSHSLRRMWNPSVYSGASGQLNEEQSEFLSSFPRVGKRFLGHVDEIETDSLQKDLPYDSNITIPQRVSFNNQLYNQNYRNTHIAAVFSNYFSEYLSTQKTQQHSTPIRSNMVLFGAPIHILPLPHGFAQGVNDVMEGSLHRVNRPAFDPEFIHSLFTINTGIDIKWDQFAYPANRSGYGRASQQYGSNHLLLLKQREKTDKVEKVEKTVDKKSTNSPTNLSVSQSTLKDPQTSALVKNSPSIAAYLRDYSVYRLSCQNATTNTSNHSRGSVVLASFLYPLFSYFILNLMYADTIRNAIVMKHMVPLDVIDSFDYYEVYYKNWFSTQQSIVYSSPDTHSIDKNTQLSLIQYQRKSPPNYIPTRPLTTPISNSDFGSAAKQKGANSTQSELQNMLRGLGVRESVLSLALSNISNDMDHGLLLPGVNGKKTNFNTLGNTTSKLTFGVSLPGHDATYGPDFVLCGLNVLEQLAKNIPNHDDKNRLVSSGSLNVLKLLQVLQNTNSSLSISTQTPCDITTPVGDITTFINKPTNATMLDSVIATDEFYKKVLERSPAIQAPYQLFPTNRATSLTYVSTILRGVMGVACTAGAVAVLLTHPGFAPMFNAIAIPQRQITQRILQWVHLKNIIDLGFLQTRITAPLFAEKDMKKTAIKIGESGQNNDKKGTLNQHQLFFSLDNAPRRYESSPSVSPEFSSQLHKDYTADDDDFMPILSLASILSIPSTIRAKLTDIPKNMNLSLNLGDFFSKNKSQNATPTPTLTTTSTTTSSTSSSNTVSNNVTAPSRPGHFAKLQHYSGQSLLDAILPFFSKSQQKYKPTPPYPLSLQTSTKTGKSFGNSSFYGILYNLYPSLHDSAFQNLQKRHFSRVNDSFNRLRTTLSQHSAMIELLDDHILRTDPLTRRRWLDYQQHYALRSVEFRKMRPDYEITPTLGAMLNFMSVTLSHVQAVIKAPAQPVHLALRHALQELGYSYGNVAEISHIFNRNIGTQGGISTMTLNSSHKSQNNPQNPPNSPNPPNPPNIATPQQLLSAFTPQMNTDEYYPAKIELDYLLRFDDTLTNFKLRLPPHIFFHVLRHFAPMSLDDVHRSITQQKDQYEIHEQTPAVTAGTGTPVETPTNKSKTFLQKSQKAAKKGKNTLVSLIASSAAGITDLARGLIATNEENDDKNEENSMVEEINEATISPNIIDSITNDNINQSHEVIDFGKQSTGYLTMLFRHVSEILTVLSFFVDNLCDCQSDPNYSTSSLYRPTPCHTRKALTSLSQSPWTLPQSTSAFSQDGISDGWSSHNPINSNYSTDILHDLISQYHSEQQYLRDSSLLSSLSNDNIMSRSEYSISGNVGSVSYSKSRSTMSVGRNGQQSIQNIPSSPATGTKPDTPTAAALTNTAPSDNSMPKYTIPTSLLNPHSLRSLLPNKFLFKFTDICSVCGLLLRSTSATTATSHTLNGLRDLQMKLYQTLYESGAAHSNAILPSNQKVLFDKFVAKSTTSSTQISKLTPLDTLHTVLKQSFGEDIYSLAKEHNLWLMIGNDIDQTQQSTHVFNVLIVESEEEDEEFEGEIDLSKIEVIEGIQTVAINGKDVDMPFYTYMISVHTVLHATIEGVIAHIVDLSSDPFKDVDPFKLNKNQKSDDKNKSNNRNNSTDSKDSNDDNDDKSNDGGSDLNPENSPVLICFNEDLVADINETDLDLDPHVIVGLVALYNKVQFSKQQTVYDTTLTALKTGANVRPTSGDGGFAKKDDDDASIDGPKNPHLNPGSQYQNTTSFPPYSPAPTRYIRYFELERLFYHSNAQLNNVRQQRADKLFVYSAQKAHDLTILQINTFLNRQYTLQQSNHRASCQGPIELTLEEQDRLYDSLYSYNLMFHLSQFFSEHSLINALSSRSGMIDDYTPLPLTNITTGRISGNNVPTTSVFDCIDPIEQKQALTFANTSVTSANYGFRTELLVTALEALHLTLPTVVRTFTDAEDTVTRFDEGIRDAETKLQQLVDIEIKINTALEAAASSNNVVSLLQLKKQQADVANAKAQIQNFLKELLSEKSEVSGRFGNSKMILSDPEFISRVLTTYNWVCGFIMACMSSSCIYCRDVQQQQHGDDKTQQSCTRMDKKGIVNHSDDEKLLCQLLSRTFTCSCPHALVGVIPEYWIQDLWQWLNTLNNMGDPTLKIFCQTNALDSLLLVAISTVGQLGAKTFSNVSLESLQTMVSNPITNLSNPGNINPGKVRTFESIINIINENSKIHEQIENDPQNDDDQNDTPTFDSNKALPTIDINLSTIRTLIETKSEIEYMNATEDKEFILDNFASFSVPPLLDANIAFNLDSSIVHVDNSTKTTIMEDVAHKDQGFIQTQQFISKSLCLIQNELGESSSGQIVQPHSPKPIPNSQPRETRYINHLSPLYVLISSHLTHFTNLPVMSLYPYVEGTFSTLFSTNQTTSSTLPTLTQLIYTRPVPPISSPSIHHALRAPLQLYLTSVLTTFLPTSDPKKSALQAEYLNKLPHVMKTAQITKNIIPNTTRALTQWPYSRIVPQNDQKAANLCQNSHIPGYPHDQLSALLLSQSNMIPHDAQNAFTTVSPTGIANVESFSGQIPTLPVELFHQYNSRHIKELAQDAAGHVSPKGISWWPMKYLHLDSTVHPLWRTGRQSVDLMTLLVHLYASTASTDNVEVTNEQDRLLVWQAQREKYNNKNSLTELFNTVLLTEAEGDLISQGQNVPYNFFSQIEAINKQNHNIAVPIEGTDSNPIDQQSYVTSCNQSVLQYELWRQKRVRSEALKFLVKKIKNSQNPSKLTQEVVTSQITAQLFPNTSTISHGFLPVVSRLDNGHCYCGCTCYGCGCGFDYFPYQSLSLPSELRALHIPPPPTTCFCGQHTKSLTKLAISTSVSTTSDQNHITINDSLSAVTRPLSFQGSMGVSLQTLLVEHYNGDENGESFGEETTKHDQNKLEIEPVQIQFPLFDRFINVLCNDISYYMEDVLHSLQTLKEREIKGIRITEEDVERFDRESEQRQRTVGAGGDDGSNANNDARPEGQTTRLTADRQLHSMVYFYSEYANRSLLLLSVICSRGKIALLRPEFSGRIALIIGGYLQKLTNPAQARLISINKDLRVQLGFSPKDLISLLMTILASLAHVPSGLSIHQLTTQAFRLSHPLAIPQQILSICPGTVNGMVYDENGIEIENDSSLLKLSSEHSEQPPTGGLILLKSLVQEDTNFKLQDFNRAIDILLRSGTQETTNLEKDILERPQYVVLATIKADMAKYQNDYEKVKTFMNTTSAFSLSTSNIPQNSTSDFSSTEQQHQQHRLVVYGTAQDDRARAVSRCQARAVGVLQLYTQLNALKGYNNPKSTVTTMLYHQNTASGVENWSWIYSNQKTLILAHLLQQHGLRCDAEGTLDKDVPYVRELGLAWWPLPPPSAPVFVSLMNALKGEHEWDEYLTVRHYAPNKSTLKKLGLEMGEQKGDFLTQNSQLLDKYFATPALINVSYPDLKLPAYNYYSRPLNLTSQFWLQRVALMFSLYNVVILRNERLLNTATQDLTVTSADANPFDFSNDDEFELPDEFTDDCFLDVMAVPVQLSLSRGKLEWLSLYRALLTVEQDPFTRSPLHVNNITPLPHIQFALKLFKLRRGVLG